MIHIQTEFRPALPTVFGAKDYQEFRRTLEEMDRILNLSGAETRLINSLIASNGKKLSGRVSNRQYKIYRAALRYGILLALTGFSHRKLAISVADSALFQWFSSCAQVDGVRPASKSTIERFEKMIPSGKLGDLIHDLNRAITDEKGAEDLLYRQTALKMDEVFADTTCVETNIHFPVDWVLLRDATRTLIKAIVLIRRHGLKHRIEEPKCFMRDMNKLCIEMTHTRKKKDARKMRKTVLRRMKRLTKTIEAHAVNYRRKLEAHWEETDWTHTEALLVIARMDNVLQQLPQAVKQAHERIIGERKVPNNKKIVSLYEPDARVIVRGKAGAEVEFGNALYLAEQADGIIIDWQFIKEQPSSDGNLVHASATRIENSYGKLKSYTADRGFDACNAGIQIKESGIINAICPRSVRQLQEQLKDENFCRLQKRRAQTEGRIGIFKNAYLGEPLRSKGFANRETRIELCILTHNLWKIAKMAAQAKDEQMAEAA